MRKLYRKKTSLLMLVLLLWVNNIQAQVASITINNVNANVMTNTKLLFGITFDSRTSLMGYPSTSLIGYYDSSGVVIPQINTIFNNFPMSTLRYPGNGIAVGFNWKKSIGPVNFRPNQNLMGTQGPPQPVKFGFDEFMSMTAAKGVPSSEIQIMVPIYDSASTSLTLTQSRAAVPNVISHNADWVEYCNSPSDGNTTNPGGGTDWAEVRAANGHPAPYGIKIWNIGNEPWSGFEYGNTSANCNDYLNDVTPIINAMLAIDPSLKITIPTTGNPTYIPGWSYALLNSALVAQGKVYAVSAHYFPTENNSTQSINNVSTSLNILNNVASTKGVKVFVGDYAHYITDVNPSPAQKDSAMQWLGANLSADMLLMLSQKSTIERANFWIYGNASATWHPIRKNSTGNYTSMPVAEIYKILFPAFLENSINVTTSSPIAADGRYAIRSNAFVSSNLYYLNIVAVNRDKLNTIPLQINGDSGYTINHAKIYTAVTGTSETIIESVASTDSSGNYLLPPMSILILEYTSNILVPIMIGDFSGVNKGNYNALSWNTFSEQNNFGFDVERSTNANNFEKIGFISGSGNTSQTICYNFDDKRLLSNKYFYRLRQIDNNRNYKFSKVIVVRKISPTNISFLYPNPSDNILYFSENLKNIEVYDVKGNLIIGEIKSADRISVCQLSAGIYLIKSDTFTGKFLKK